MAIGGLGARQDRPRLGRALGALVSGGLVLVGFYLLGSELVAYSAAGETRLSDDVQIGGVQVGAWRRLKRKRVGKRSILNSP